MMLTLTPSSSHSLESDELLLITQPTLRMQLLHARFVDEFSASSVIQRDENVYLSLRNIADEAQRREITWAVLRLQMGAHLKPDEIPDPLRTALRAVVSGPSPLLAALLAGGLSGVVGGVMVMAFVGLIITVLNIPAESYVGITATAVAFVMSGAVIGCGATVYFWRRFTQKTGVSPLTAIYPKFANKSK